MRADSPLWRVMGDSAQAQEAEALERVRTLLPDDGICRAWVNVTFTDNDGRLNEVDVLLLTKSGMFVVELKGWHGEIAGDQRNWHHAGRTERSSPVEWCNRFVILQGCGASFRCGRRCWRGDRSRRRSAAQ
ncbi:nuclease-related domain-containing protein [Leucobacter sp. W1153]|uniref:nuclease-related domain-containing protein n=1 Tax=Leucobacter sp. W1153 TaxID=3439064 RepID=UPI003F30760C